ncbi:MAG: 3-oxoacyl-[acyl-carrier protein] reductase [Gammaproteobacteria bacterium]|nr:3-oxoacyl-[acyl-carrier protein] reductase [Gammaproteobacteria bacterium]
MTTEESVDASFVGLDNGEFATIRVLPDQRERDGCRRGAPRDASALSPRNPAERFGLKGCMNLGIDKRRAVVTGASRGLGRAIAAALAAEGADVVGVARNIERLAELSASLAPDRGSFTARAGDLADPAAIEGLGDVLGEADILVLNTGGPPPGPITDVTDATWIKQFESMFLSIVRLTRLALPGMRKRKFGRIIIVVSSGVQQPIANLGISNALRMTVVGWAKTLAAEVAADGVTVNCLAPGRIATDRVAELDAGAAGRRGVSVAEIEQQARAAIPIGRYGDPAEFAAMAAFLAGDGAAYMTGSVIRVDGGMIRGA